MVRCNNALKPNISGAQNTIMKYTVILDPDERGGYTVTVHGLPGCISEGKTKEDALANIKDAIGLYEEMLDKDLKKKSPNATEIEIEV
ncbi:protein of unknown function UPF0150 [Methanoregula boonei 6A8]|jgi:predicted RNase H-like HicB family nuclease|uniref:HicB-like antitoxin of toxin-antitoxin system domain-containing protein n=2 Tax=Methanoregula TaxID=395331 RepID=A7I676_METB6|nr:protein of unknown function UPF0150 [Methanoregula boonei 6A8]